MDSDKESARMSRDTQNNTPSAASGPNGLKHERKYGVSLIKSLNELPKMQKGRKGGCNRALPAPAWFVDPNGVTVAVQLSIRGGTDRRVSLGQKDVSAKRE